MAATGLEKDIDLAGPRKRTRGTLLSVARPIPASELTKAGVNRLPAGIEWTPWGDGGVTAEEVGCSVVYDKNARNLPGNVYQPSFLIWDALTCSNMTNSLAMLWDRLDTNFEVQLSYAFASQLEDAAQGGIGLIGANNYVGTTDYPPTIVTTAASSLQLAMALLEDFLGSKLRGGLGVIHLTPGLYSIAVALGLVDEDTSKTPTGHDVIGDAGHTGEAAPTGDSAPGDGEKWIYATGDIWYAVADQDKMMDAETGEGFRFVRRNTDRPLQEVYGLLAFDPNIIGAALVDYAETTAGGGGGAGGGDASAANQDEQTTLLTALDGRLTNLEDALTADAATLSNVASQDTNINLLASNASRRGVIIHNDDTGTLYVKFGATASTTSYTYKVLPGEHLEILVGAIYAGAIDGIWTTSGSGSARITELT